MKQKTFLPRFDAKEAVKYALHHPRYLHKYSFYFQKLINVKETNFVYSKSLKDTDSHHTMYIICPPFSSWDFQKKNTCLNVY